MDIEARKVKNRLSALHMSKIQATFIWRPRVANKQYMKVIVKYIIWFAKLTANKIRKFIHVSCSLWHETIYRSVDCHSCRCSNNKMYGKWFHYNIIPYHQQITMLRNHRTSWIKHTYIYFIYLFKHVQVKSMKQECLHHDEKQALIVIEVRKITCILLTVCL